MVRRCSFKKHAGGKACPCGCLGKKFCKVPLPFTLEPLAISGRILSTARKWRKKKAIRTLAKVKEKFEGEDDFMEEDTNIDGENWFPVNFCFLVPKESKKFKEFEHQTAGVACMHHKIRGEIIEIPLRPCEEKVMNRMFSRMNISDQNHIPHYKVIKRVISYLKLPVNAVERRVDLIKKRDYNDAVNCEMAFAEALGASPDVSHEAWQWVDVTGGSFSRVPALKQYVGQRVLLIYPNSD